MARRTHDEDPHPKRTAQEWCDYGNAKLAGEIPSCSGDDCSNAYRAKESLPPMRWVVRNGVPVPEFVERVEPHRETPRYYWQDEQT